VALAWLLHRSPVVLPIPGTESVGHLEENCAAASPRRYVAASEGRADAPPVHRHGLRL